MNYKTVFKKFLVRGCIVCIIFLLPLFSFTALFTLADTPVSLLHTASKNSATDGGGNMNITVPLTATGSLLVAWVSSGSSLSGASLSDSINGTWSTAIAPGQICSQYGSYNCAAFYFCNSGSGVSTVTLHAPSQGFNGDTVVYAEYSGIATSSCLDQTSAIGSWVPSGTWSSPTIATAQANELLIGFIWNGSVTTLTGTNGFTNEISAQNSGAPFTIGLEDRVVSSIGSYSAQGTMSSGGAHGAILAFKTLDTGGGSDTTPPTLSSITAGSITTTSATIAWNTDENSDTQVEYGLTTSYGSSSTLNSSLTTSHSAAISSLIPGTTYHYRVKSRDASGNLAVSTNQTFTTTATPPTDTTPPSTPTNLTATAVSSSQINLSWTASTDNIGVTGYKIYRNSTQITTTSNTSYSDPSLSPSTAYSYTVSAYDAANNNSSQSSSVSATTQAQTTTSGSDIYISQSGQGTQDGSSCTNAKPVAFFNAASNWASTATSGKISPGTTVHLCGVITIQLIVQGNGTPGNPIKILWELGARVSLPFGQIISLNGNHGYLLFDGGTACGPGTSCDAIEAVNQTGYVAGQTGIIEATSNGSGLGHQDAQTQAFAGCDGCHDIEIKNLIVRNLYRHTSVSDFTNSADTGNFIFQCAYGNSGCLGAISIHDLTIHDTGNSVSFQRGNNTTLNIYNTDFYRNNWAVEMSGDGSRIFNFYNNHIHDTANWDTSNDMFHHNAIHFYMNSATDSISTNVYDNLSDGNWGTCCTTATMIFSEVSNPSNFNIYNNVEIQYPGNLAPAFEYGATGGLFVNNTIIGSITSGNVAAIQVYGGGINFQNNAVTNYGQYIYVHPGTTFTAFDYNQWGTVGGNGNSPWQWQSTGSNTFAQWKSACGCDTHGSNSTSFGTNGSGVPQTGSALIGAGLNLTSLGITALNSDKAGNPRPSSGPWDIGAYQYTGSVITYTLTSTSGTGGTITPSGVTTVNSGSSQTFTITPNSGYIVSSILVDGVNQATSTTYTFNNVTSNHTISVSFSLIQQPDTTAPTIPANLTATVASSTQINLSWAASTDPVVSGQTTSGVVGYKIYRNGSLLATANSLLTTYSDTNLFSSTTYTYTVAAYDGANNTSSLSASVSATTPSGTPILGDINLDHIVNTLDYSLMNTKWFQSYPSYDLTGDNLINTLDYAILKNNWGKTW